MLPAPASRRQLSTSAINGMMNCRQPRQDLRRRRRPLEPAGWRPKLLLLFSYSILCAFTLLSNDGQHQQHENHKHHKQQASFKSLISLVEAGQTSPSPAAQAQPQMSTLNSHSNNLYQAVSQMYQVFNGNDSQSFDANHFKTLELADEDTLLVGSR